MPSPTEVLVIVTDLANGPALAAAIERIERLRFSWLDYPTAVELCGDWGLEPEIMHLINEHGFDSTRLGADGPAPVPVDVAQLPTANRRKRLLLADMDSTIIGQECIDELAGVAGVRAEVGAITERAMRGEINFAGSITERVAMLKGLDAAVIDRILTERITLNPGAMKLVATMRAHGAHTALVSGGFTQFVAKVAEWAGFDSWQANTLEIEGGRLTGRLVPPILDQSAKASELGRLANMLGIPRAETLAVGDGANDVEMISAAGLGVAYRAKPVLEQAARVSIRRGDLTALLHLQGYRREEHVG